MSENHFDIVLEQLEYRSVSRLFTADTFDEQAFEALRDHLWQKAEALQHESYISKQILMTLRKAVLAVRSRAEYLPEVHAKLHWADEFESMLDRLIAGETRAARQPGTPRII